MRLRRLLTAARRRATLRATLVGAAGLAALAGCNNDVNITDPNAPSSQTFFANKADADAGLNATYNALIRLGTFQRWQGFSYDMRSDEGTSFSPWPELQAFVKFQFPSGYNFDVNIDTWNDSYTLISRANQVIAAVPGIAGMTDVDKARIVGEAQFLRGLTYFHLMTLYGGNIPLIIQQPAFPDRPASADSAKVWAQIEADFTAAAAGITPATATAQSTGGRATSDAARGMLGKTLLQERKWSAAAAALQPIVQSGRYTLVPNYATLFRKEGNNGPESLFEVQMGDTIQINTNGLGGLNMSKMIGPCGPSYCDGRPTRWFFDQFNIEKTTTGGTDPRLDATLYYYKGDTTTVYGQTWGQRGYRTDDIFWKKYGEYYIGSQDQTWEAQINFKVLRYADVLLMYAEALNEGGSPGQAKQYVDQVRARAQLAALPATLDQAGMRSAILKERLLEFGLESQRWLDLGRQNLFATQASIDVLKTHDSDFDNFVRGKSELLPIPQTERNLNPNVNQNPNW